MRKNKKDKKQDINYLDLIPETNQSIRWHRDLKQRIILEIENKGMFNTIAQKVFGKPRFSKVHLDEMGTFIWPEIDGTKTVQDLALLVYRLKRKINQALLGHKMRSLQRLLL